MTKLALFAKHKFLLIIKQYTLKAIQEYCCSNSYLSSMETSLGGITFLAPQANNPPAGTVTGGGGGGLSRINFYSTQNSMIFFLVKKRHPRIQL